MPLLCNFKLALDVDLMFKIKLPVKHNLYNTHYDDNGMWWAKMQGTDLGWYLPFQQDSELDDLVAIGFYNVDVDKQTKIVEEMEIRVIGLVWHCHDLPSDIPP